jgi:parvulin-like peptidyl-prolyl isomerase
MKGILIVFTIFLAVTFSGCKKDTTSQDPSPTEQAKQNLEKQINSRVVLTINQIPFTNRAFKSYIKSHYDLSTNGSPSDSLRSRFFDAFVDNKILLTAAEQQGLTISNDEVNEYLSEHNIPQEKFQKELILENIKIKKFLYIMVYRNIDVTNAEIRQHYTKNPQTFRKREEIKLYQILVKNKEKATEISGILRNSPRRFAEIARKESISPEAKNDGFMGFFEKGVLPRELEDVVFSLDINAISPVVDSPHGYHIFKVTQKRRGKQQYLSKVRSQIKDNLLSQKMDQAYMAFLSQLKKRFVIKINHQDLFFKYQPNQGV